MARSFRPPWVAARVAAATVVLAATHALAQPAWVVDPEGVYGARPGAIEGVAYVEAARFPAALTQEATGLFVVCSTATPDAYDLFLWAGAVPSAALDAAGTVEVLTRRADDAARSARWTVDDDPNAGQVLVANPAVRALLLDDLRLGGSLAVRVVTDPAAGAAQPTFVYEVDGFPEVELDCAARAAAANDPFAGAPIVPVEPADDDPFADAPVVPVDPFADAPAPADPFADAPAAPADPFADAPAAPADPFADAPAAPDPFAAPPAPADPFADAPPAPAPGAPADPFADAPSDGFDDPGLFDPTTGLLSLFGTIDEFAPLPPRVDLTQMSVDPDQVLLYTDVDAFSAIGGFCNPNGGGDNGFVIEFASPAFAGYGERATLVLYFAGQEVGYAELGVYRDNGTAAGYLLYDADELGVLRALTAFHTLEAVLTGDGVERAQAYWSFATLDLASAIAEMSCVPAY